MQATADVDRLMQSAQADRRAHPRHRCRTKIDGAEDPAPRRLPSRPDADRQGRCLHPRFRGRAGPLARRAAAEGAGRARRRGPDPLDRLLDHRGAAQRRQPHARGTRHRSPPKLAIWRRKATEEFWNACRQLRRSVAVAERRRRGRPEPARFLPARKGVLRNGIRADEPAGVAARSARRNVAHPAAARRGDSHERDLTRSAGDHRAAITPTRSTISACMSRTTRRWCACSCPTPRP